MGGRADKDVVSVDAIAGFVLLKLVAFFLIPAFDLRFKHIQRVTTLRSK